MEIESIRHKALRDFAETGKPRGLPGNLVDRLRKMLAYVVAIEAEEELKAPPNFGAHQLTGDRAGVWSLTVTKNWRMTFRINDALAIEDMDLEDYHRWLSSCILASPSIPALGSRRRSSDRTA